MHSMSCITVRGDVKSGPQLLVKIHYLFYFHSIQKPPKRVKHKKIVCSAPIQELSKICSQADFLCKITLQIHLILTWIRIRILGSTFGNSGSGSSDPPFRNSGSGSTFGNSGYPDICYRKEIRVGQNRESFLALHANTLTLQYCLKSVKRKFSRTFYIRSERRNANQ